MSLLDIYKKFKAAADTVVEADGSTGNTVKILKNGVNYPYFDRLSVKKDLDYLGGSFSFDTFSINGRTVPFIPMDEVKIYINGILVLTGQVFVISVNYSTDSHSIKIEGYSKSRVLVDNSIINNAQKDSGEYLQKLIVDTLKEQGITSLVVENDPNNIKITEDTSAEIEESIFEYLNRYASLAGAIITTNRDGNIEIYRNDGLHEGIYSGVILRNKFKSNNNNHILQANFVQDFRERYEEVTVVSQATDDPIRLTKQANPGVDISLEDGQTVTDTALKDSERKLLIVANSELDEEEALVYATWEVNNRIAKSLKYNCTVTGFGPISNKAYIYELNYTFLIDDEYASINKVMLIKSIDYQFDSSRGHTTQLTFIPSNSYKLDTTDPNLVVYKEEDVINDKR